LNSVLMTFNGYHPRLRFTHELENNNRINFLNVAVIRDGGNNIITDWFRKPTFSGRYINYYSNHPLQYKLNTIMNLVDQAILLSDERFHEANLVIVKNILLNNGYPSTLLNKQIIKRYKHLIKNMKNGCITTRNVRTDNRIYTLTIPYAGNVSKDIKRIVKNIVNVRYSIPKKLDNLIIKGKDRLENHHKTEVSISYIKLLVKTVTKYILVRQKGSWKRESKNIEIILRIHLVISQW